MLIFKSGGILEIQKLITFLPTTSLDATSQFYEEIFKLELILDQGDCRIYKTCQNAYVGFCLREFEIINGKIILTFVVEDVENQHKHFSTFTNLVISDLVVNEKYNL